MSGFQKAVKSKSKLRLALDGPSGAGKTWTALTTARALAQDGAIAVIDSERGSASKYADRFEFDVLELEGNFHPDRYIDGIRQAAAAGYTVVVIDSLTHAWAGKNGVLEQVDAAKSRFGGNSHMAWSVGTPLWQALIDAMIQAPLHVIATMRSKTKFVEEEDSRGRKTYKRAGTEPVARDGIEYEFDFVGDLDLDHNLVISKSRAGDAVETLYRRPGAEFGAALLAWLESGAEPTPVAPKVDVAARGRDLAAIAGPDHADDLRAALAEAKIGRAALADDDTFERAKAIAESIANPDPAAVPFDPETGEVRTDLEQAADRVIDSRMGPPREPDDPRPEPAPAGQTSLGSGL